MEQNHQMLAFPVVSQHRTARGEFAPAQPYAKWRISRSQGVRSAPKCFPKKQRLKPPTEGIPEPTQHSRALYYFLCSAYLQSALFLSLTFLLLYLTGKHHWLGREQWETAPIHTPSLSALLAAERGSYLRWKLPHLHFAPPSPAISYSQGSRHCIGGTGLFHTMLLWGSHGLKWKHKNRPVPLGVLNKY